MLEPWREHAERLGEIGLRCKTDKVRRHNYHLRYARHLWPWVEDEFTLLEIGVKRGSSVFMWREFFPRARIVGIDIKQECAELADDRLEIEIGDQGDPDFLRQVTDRHGPFRVVIDDGGHRMSQQRKSFEALWPGAVEPGGFYVIEDLQTSAIRKFIDEEPVTTRRIGDLVHRLCSDQEDEVESLHCYPRIVFVRRQSS